ncbi:MAG TPA: hypothetical protein VNN20_10300 [Thermodesulfobacteriota bacterium]|nr:hypothetical protein [Thermodesulfobacteriota bacterium]
MAAPEEGSRTFVLQIDNHNRINYVDDEWLSFASENDAGFLTRDQVLNKHIFKFISAFETILLYQLIFEKVRNKNKKVTVPLRCDSPDYRRYMYVECQPSSKDHITIISHLIKQLEREYVSLLDYKLERTDETISICSWCKKVNIDKNIWVEAEVVEGILKISPKPNPPKLSHTACPACYNGLMVIISA